MDCQNLFAGGGISAGFALAGGSARLFRRLFCRRHVVGRLDGRPGLLEVQRSISRAMDSMERLPSGGHVRRHRVQFFEGKPKDVARPRSCCAHAPSSWSGDRRSNGATVDGVAVAQGFTPAQRPTVDRQSTASEQLGNVFALMLDA